MAKKIAVVNDLSGFGRCSLTAAISVISAMGVQPCPLPTAILTAQTEYPSYYLSDCTDHMEHFRREWEKMGQTFDGIYTGFVASEAQIHEIFRFIETFGTPGAFLLVDPIMGDDGVKYDTFTPTLLEQMKILSRKADIITPNVTELCLLADIDFAHIQKLSRRRGSKKEILKILRQTALSFGKDGPRHIIITGVHFTDKQGISQIGNFYVTGEETFFYFVPYIGKSYSGTGDLFASCVAAGVARGDTIPDTIHRAGDFLEAAIKDSVREQIPENDGVNYEKYLSKLGTG